MLTRSKDVSAQVAMIQEAAAITAKVRKMEGRRGYHSEAIDLMYAQKRVLRKLIVVTLGYMTHAQFDAAVDMQAEAIRDAEEAAYQAEQDQLEYEYQQAHNI